MLREQGCDEKDTSLVIPFSFIELSLLTKSRSLASTMHGNEIR